MTEEIFKFKTFDFDKLLSFGFILKDDCYTYITNILEDDLQLTVEVDRAGTVKTKVIDNKTQEEYVLYLVKSLTGEYVGRVRQAVENVLSEIGEKCCKHEVFKGNQTKEIIDYVKNTFDDNLEFLWEKSPDCAIWRRKDNRKWYALLMVVPKNKFGFDSDKMVEVLSLRGQTQNLVDHESIFEAYHMNKTHWISVILNEKLPTIKVFELLNSSYQIAKESNKKRGDKK